MSVFITRLTKALQQHDTGDWTPTRVKRVIDVVSEVLVDAVSNGEEIQIGKLGRFSHIVQKERTTVNNLPNQLGARTTPKKLKIKFEPSGHTKSKLQLLEKRLHEL